MKKLILLLLPLLYACSYPKEQTGSISVPTINMNDHTSLIFADWIEDISCVVLSDNYYLENWKVLCYLNYIYVYSLSDFSVFVYTDTGKLLKKIDNRGKNKLVFPTDIYIDTLKNELLILDDHKYLNQYSLKGEFIRRRILPFTAVSMCMPDETHFLFYDGRLETKSPFNILISLQDSLSIQKAVIYRDTKKHINGKIPHNTFTLEPKNKITYCLFPNNDTIYTYNPKINTVEAYCRLDFAGDLLVEEMFPAKGFSDQEFASLMQKKQYIFTINGFYQACGHLFFKLEGKRNHYCMLDLRTNKLSTFDSVFDGLCSDIVGGDGEQLYFTFRRKDLIEQYTEKKPSYKCLAELLSKDDNGDDWILIKTKLKKIRL